MSYGSKARKQNSSMASASLPSVMEPVSQINPFLFQVALGHGVY